MKWNENNILTIEMFGIKIYILPISDGLNTWEHVYKNELLPCRNKKFSIGNKNEFTINTNDSSSFKIFVGCMYSFLKLSF